MRGRVGDGEADRHEVEERRVGEPRALSAKIVAGMEDELERADARLARRDQRRIGPSVRVGGRRGDEASAAVGGELVKLDPDAGRRAAARDVENVGGQAGQDALLFLEGFLVQKKINWDGMRRKPSSGASRHPRVFARGQALPPEGEGNAPLPVGRPIGRPSLDRLWRQGEG